MKYSWTGKVWAYIAYENEVITNTYDTNMVPSLNSLGVLVNCKWEWENRVNKNFIKNEAII